MLRKTFSWCEGPRFAFPRVARTLVSVIDKLTGSNFLNAANVVERSVRLYGEHVVQGAAYKDLDEVTARALKSYLDYENTICWEVPCVHVANYLDKSFADYFEHESRAVKLLPTLCERELNESFWDARLEGRKLLHEIRKAYDTQEDPTDKAEGALPSAGTRSNDGTGTGVVS